MGVLNVLRAAVGRGSLLWQRFDAVFLAMLSLFLVSGSRNFSMRMTRFGHREGALEQSRDLRRVASRIGELRPRNARRRRARRHARPRQPEDRSWRPPTPRGRILPPKVAGTCSISKSHSWGEHICIARPSASALVFASLGSHINRRHSLGQPLAPHTSCLIPCVPLLQ